MHNKACKEDYRFHFHSKNLVTLTVFITNTLKYKDGLSLKFNSASVALCLSDKSLFM